MKRSNTILYIKLVQENDYAEVYGHYLVKGVTIDEFQKKITVIKESLTNENSKDFNDAWELEDVFKMLPLAEYAAKEGGVLPCVYNASNEVAAGLFLEEKIGFTDIPRIVDAVVKNYKNIQAPTLDDILLCDANARDLTMDLYTRKAW